MDNVFIKALALNQPLDQWNHCKECCDDADPYQIDAVAMFRIFSGAKQFKQNDSLNQWNLEQVKYKREMFDDAVHFM